MQEHDNYYYSAKRNAFYPSSLKADYISAGSWPDDVIELDDKTYAALLEGQSEGKCIAADEQGRPVLCEPLPPTPEAMLQSAAAKKARLMQEAQERISLLERAVKLAMATDGERQQLQEWERYSILLFRVDISRAPDIDWPAQPE